MDGIKGSFVLPVGRKGKASLWPEGFPRDQVQEGEVVVRASHEL